MRLWSDSFTDGGVIAAENAFGQIDPASHVRFASNRNPHLAWDGVPAGTASLILFCIDIDAPTVGTDVNHEGREVPDKLARADFFHWVLADIPADWCGLAEGRFSSQVTPHGKPGPELLWGAPDGAAQLLRQGCNDYTGWFAQDPAMAGQYFGYDGPCPPWNDARVHRYVFCLYALDCETLPLDGSFTGAEALQAIHGHIIDEAQILGVYSLNPALAATLAQ